MILDTNVLIRRVKAEIEISDNITGITQVEYPPILEYQKFYGKVVYPIEADIDLASSIQMKLRKAGTPESAQDIIIAAICINRGETLVTTDEDFKEIAKVSKLRIIFE